MTSKLNLSNLTLCELKNLLYKNNKDNKLDNKLDNKTITIINELIDLKIKKSHIYNNHDKHNNTEIDPIKKITSLLIENNISNNSDYDYSAESAESDNSEQKNDNPNSYYGHNKFKNSKKVRNEHCTQSSEKLLNRLMGEASFRYQDEKNKVIKPYSIQDKEINTTLGKRKNLF